MLFQTTTTLCTLTLSRHELAALLTVASTDLARVDFTAVLFDPAARVAVATDGHRLLAAVASPVPYGGANTDAKAKLEHQRAHEAEARRGIDREIVISRENLAAWLKACGAKEAIRITWADGTRGKPQEVNACTVDASGREGAKFSTTAAGVAFPPWRSVMPKQPSKPAAVIAVNVNYVADAMTALGKVTGKSILPAVCLWSAEAPDEDTIKKAKANGGPVGSLSPMFATMDHTGADGVPVSWRYVVMPMRHDIPRDAWDIPAKPAKTDTLKREDIAIAA